MRESEWDTAVRAPVSSEAASSPSEEAVSVPGHGGTVPAASRPPGRRTGPASDTAASVPFG
ncbi:hypothetical protein OG741_00755 [Streptomyces sp. NBC_01410]|uniref:hypothetical protein n=1 Tax=Streptomyces sp. NBC_01410 TaxID=2903856 RepID=UPI003243C967